MPPVHYLKNIPPAGLPTVPKDLVLDHLAWSGGAAGWLGGRQSAGYSAAKAALDRLVTLGIAQRDDCFDIGEIVNSIAAYGLQGQMSFWHQEIATGRALVKELAGQDADNGRPIGARRFTVSFSRRFHAAELPPGRVRLRIPMPIGDDQLNDLSVECDEKDSRSSPGRLELVCSKHDRRDITVSARYTFEARGNRSNGDAITTTQQALYLRENEGTVAVTASVRALARELASDLSPSQALEVFRNHLLDQFACGYVHYDQLDGMAASDWVLKNRWYDCRLGASLFTSLCRAHGIPARLVGGYLLWNAPAEHYWMEAWISGQGWTPYDLLAWGLSAAGTDAHWRNVYSGWTDYRMKTQIFPDVFTGAVGIPLPAALHRVYRRVDGGSELRILAAEDGRELYRDTILIK